MVLGRPTVAGPQRKGFASTSTCDSPEPSLWLWCRGPGERWEGQHDPWKVDSGAQEMVLLHPNLAPQVKMSSSFVTSDHSHPQGPGHLYPQTPRVLSAPGCSLVPSTPFGAGIEVAQPDHCQLPALWSFPDLLLSRNPERIWCLRHG